MRPSQRRPNRRAPRLGRLAHIPPGAIETVLTALAFVGLHQIGLVGDLPIWALLGLLGLAGLTKQLALLVCGVAGGTPWQLHLRLLVELAGSTAVIYATGWGPMLAVGYLVIVAENLRQCGAAAWRPAAIWVLVCMAAGQVAIALGWVPTYVASPAVDGLAVLSALGLVCVIRLLGVKTEAVQLEREERGRAEDAARDSELRFLSLVQTSFDLVTVLDATVRVTYVSPNVVRLCGYSAAEYTVMANRRDLIHPDDKARTAEVIGRLLVHPGEEPTLEIRHRHADGTWRWHELRLRNLLANPAVAGIVANARDVTEERAYRDRLAHAATHDSLTGLVNRDAFGEHLSRRLAAAGHRGEPLAVLIVDLDRFKEVNDTFGHRAGDDLLREVARRLEAETGEADLVARLGGDEFAVTLSTSADAAGADATARRLVATLERPLVLAGRSIWVGASVGIARFPDHGGDPQTLLHCADLAMYEAKRTAIGAVAFHAGLERAQAQGPGLILELPRAIEADELVLHYQPKLNLRSGEVVGVEALVRWAHPRLGLLGPSEFMPLAETTGLVRQVTSWVLDRALRQAAVWRAAGRDLGVAVNVSARDLADDHLPQRVAALLATHGVPATLLTLELTESAIMADEAKGLEILARLRGLGLRTSLDDFGTGYSSLAYLERLPLDEFKIDRSFLVGTLNEANTFMVRTIASIGHHLGLQIVAEGIEDPRSIEFAAGIGCDLLQGFALSSPLSAADLEAWLDVRPATSLRPTGRAEPDATLVRTGPAGVPFGSGPEMAMRGPWR